MKEKVFEHEYALRPFRDDSDCVIRFAHKSTYENPKTHKLHLNDHIELFIPLTQIDYLAGGRVFHLQRGEILPIVPHTVHAAVPKTGERYERMYIVAPLSSMRRFSRDPIDEIVRACSSSVPVMIGEDKADELFRALSEAEKCLCGTPRDEMRTFFSVADAVCTVADCVSAGECREAVSESGLPDVVRAVLAYIDAKLPNVDGVSEIADAVGFSLPYVSKRFREAVGVSVTEYLISRKLARAKGLLEGGADVTEACFASGFHDISYFIKKFREQTGVTPFRYKKFTGNVTAQ